jgi:hypothetical protein
MAICRPEAIDAAPVHGPKQSGGWRRGDFLASRGMGVAQGKKVEPPPLRLRRSRRSRPLARSANERPWVARRNSILGRSRGQPEGSCTRGPTHRAKRRRPWRRKRTTSSQPNRSQTACFASCRLHQGKGPSKRSSRAATASRVETSAYRADLRQPVRRWGRGELSDSGREAARQQASKRPRCPVRPPAGQMTPDARRPYSQRQQHRPRRIPSAIRCWIRR